jgi:protein SCO1/2
VHTAAITYDPAFDSPQRLRGYAESRGMHLAPGHGVLRVVEGQERVREAFGLGVSFAASVVNRHRIEAFVLDAAGQVAVIHRRLQWREDELLEDLQRLLSEAEKPAAAPARAAPQPMGRGMPSLASTLLAVAMALFPKCPLCGLSYLSLSGLAALPQLPGWYWTWPVFALAFLASLVALAWRPFRQGRWPAVMLGTAGAAVLLGVGVAQQNSWGLWGGVALCAAGAMAGVLGVSRGTPMES